MQNNKVFTCFDPKITFYGKMLKFFKNFISFKDHDSILDASGEFKRIVTCEKCGLQDVFILDEISAAFEQFNLTEFKCKKCGSGAKSSSLKKPPYSEKQFELWIRSDELKFLEQDEELMLSGSDVFNLVKKYANHPNILETKKAILLSALCVNVYDSHKYPEEVNVELGQKSIEELKCHIDFLQSNAFEMQVMPYIKVVVWPLIGIRFQLRK